MTRPYILPLRVSGEEKAMIEAQADAQGVTVSEYLRRRALTTENPDREALRRIERGLADLVAVLRK